MRFTLHKMSPPSLAAWLVLAAGAAAVAASLPSVQAAAGSPWLPEGYSYDWSSVGVGGGDVATRKAVGGTFDVTKYGANPNDSSLDDNGAQAALKEALKSGGTVYFPAGTFRLSKPLFANVSNVVIRGAGRDSTKLVFTKSLAQVYGAQWGVDKCTGKPKGLWTSGGALIVLSGKDKAVTPKQLARIKVTSDTQVQPGATRLPVDSTSQFSVGQWVQLVIDDKSTENVPSEECKNRLEGGQGGKVGAAGGGQMMVRPLPEWVKRDPIFQLAQQAAAREDDDTSLTVDQAAAIDARRPLAPGQVGAAAGDGTVAAWVYGDNVVDSGGPGTIDPGRVRFVFKVKSKGKGYIESDRPLIHAVKRKWTARVTEYRPAIEKVGVEDLSIQFENSGRYEGHFSEEGYNAIMLASAANSWVKNVRIVDADNGMFVRETDFSTIENVEVTSGDRTTDDGNNVNGHHGISLTVCHAVLVTKFNIAQPYWHDAGVDQSTSFSVFSNGKGKDLNMDHHRAGPMANLFSNIDVGKNTRPFNSGGRKDRGAYTGRGATFWNIRAGQGASSTSIKLPKCDFGPFLTFVLQKRSGSTCSSQKWKVISWTSSMPADLYSAQLAERRRRKRSAVRRLSAL